MTNERMFIKDKIAAGEYLDWLNAFTSVMKGKGEGVVPCGDCVACCTSSKFVHLRPSDTKAIAKIPKELLFKAPGLPEGHYLLGYNEKGHCPMFGESGCTIYHDRPETCRQYDCRALAALGSKVEEGSADIGRRAAKWEFTFSNPESVEHFEAVKLARSFLIENKELFPARFVPELGPPLAILVLRIHGEFLGRSSLSLKKNRDQIIKHLIATYKV
ncbi:MAG: YkgJ family cysteine cluster protein [Gammaproteobacteria bacterium]|nr:YkgJ family cysteine cluster protein [Gammaproteobacteria bacterium]